MTNRPNRHPAVQAARALVGPAYTAREALLLELIADYRRLSCQTVSDANECAAVHQRADAILSHVPSLDDARLRWDDPAAVEHRAFVERLFK